MEIKCKHCDSAMLCVNIERTIYRCEICGRGIELVEMESSRKRRWRMLNKEELKIKIEVILMSIESSSIETATNDLVNLFETQLVEWLIKKKDE